MTTTSHAKYPPFHIKNKAASALLEKQVRGRRTGVRRGFVFLSVFINCYKSLQ